MIVLRSQFTGFSLQVWSLQSLPWKISWTMSMIHYSPKLQDLNVYKTPQLKKLPPRNHFLLPSYDNLHQVSKPDHHYNLKLAFSIHRLYPNTYLIRWIIMKANPNPSIKTVENLPTKQIPWIIAHLNVPLFMSYLRFCSIAWNEYSGISLIHPDSIIKLPWTKCLEADCKPSKKYLWLQNVISM